MEAALNIGLRLMLVVPWAMATMNTNSITGLALPKDLDGQDLFAAIQEDREER